MRTFLLEVTQGNAEWSQPPQVTVKQTHWCRAFGMTCTGELHAPAHCLCYGGKPPGPNGKWMRLMSYTITMTFIWIIQTIFFQHQFNINIKISSFKILNSFLQLILILKKNPNSKKHLPNDITPMACTAFGFANIHASSDLGLKQTFE